MALVILAHPHFSQSVASKAVIETLQNSGLDMEIRDLAALYPDYRMDIEAEQRACCGIKPSCSNIRFTGATCPPFSN